MPVNGSKSHGPALLAAVVAAHAGELDDDTQLELEELIDDVSMGKRIAQPRLRYRLQTDRVGLTCTTHRLVQRGQEVGFDFGLDAPPVPQVLGAVYATARLEAEVRRRTCGLFGVVLGWAGNEQDILARFRSAGLDVGDRTAWARQVLGLDDPRHSRADVQRAFRLRVADAHPDRGGRHELAADRLSDLAAARRILLAVS